MRNARSDRRRSNREDESGPFESLARRLVAVPKKEIDRKAEIYKRKKKTR